MARDPGLEELVSEALGDLPGLSRKPMFGGLGILLHGHLMLGVRDEGLLVRLGKGNDGWALALPDIEPMTGTGRHMPGWVRAGLDACADDDLRQRLIAAALAFVRELPPKP